MLSADGACLLVVLLLQVHRIYGYGKLIINLLQVIKSQVQAARHLLINLLDLQTSHLNGTLRRRNRFSLV